MTDRMVYDEIVEQMQREAEGLPSFEEPEAGQGIEAELIEMCIHELLSPLAATPKNVSRLTEILLRKWTDKRGDLWKEKKVF